MYYSHGSLYLFTLLRYCKYTILKKKNVGVTVFNKKQRELKVDTFKVLKVLSSSLCNPLMCCWYTIII